MMDKGMSLKFGKMAIVALLSLNCTVQTGGFRSWMRTMQTFEHAKQSIGNKIHRLGGPKFSWQNKVLACGGGFVLGSGLGMLAQKPHVVREEVSEQHAPKLSEKDRYWNQYKDRCPKQGKDASTHFSCLLQLLPYLRKLQYGDEDEKKEGKKLAEELAKHYPRDDATILYALSPQTSISLNTVDYLHQFPKFSDQLDTLYEKKRELEKEGYAVFFHAQPSGYFFTNWFFTRLMERIQGDSFKDMFTFVHTKNPADVHVKSPSVLKNTKWPDNKDNLLFVNYLLHGNAWDGAWYESSLWRMHWRILVLIRACSSPQTWH